ncbi:Oligopeptide ABC transporter, periplasmic oligopeptide-binding protein OppA [Streptococcus sp. DD10]|uniref:peptide ABC transporter substrate-binding protein n=1 Tax=Streptococcus sp. DD10 TaxID=1777878 RepID=UPI000791D020|nr:peptide ABC transporter substrate-binding protein [Streptococcus sp. DD10]KXT72490.1 Oligopeptide ABC transporter, periplasmic oligopeptide-binding protein OppA [Streptococcus sp. DD10]
MKKKRMLALAGLSLLATATLVACGTSTSNSTNTFSYIYVTDPDSLDYLVSNRASTSDITGNFIDGLLENDKYGNLIPSLAENWTVSKDGLTYTYTLRDGIKWYTAEGEEYANVTAQDFVAGLKHAVDGKSESTYLVEDSIKGLKDYINGKTTDFSTVGVKAVDDKTVEYTLNQPESYWNSKLTASIMMPVNEEFLQSKGEDFGKVTPDGILYNGPYILSSYTNKSSFEFIKNQNYWDKDNVKIEKVKLAFSDGSDPEALAKNFADGSYTSARLYPNTSSFTSVKEKFADNIYYSPQSSSTFYYYFNLNRQAIEHTSKTTDAQKDATKQAILNKDFRQAINFAFNRTNYNAQTAGEEGATYGLRNTLVPPTFVQVGNQTFGEVVESKLTANFGEEWSGVDLSDAQDGLYNVDKAKAEFAKAKTTLEAQGVQFPIHLDIPVPQSDKKLVQEAQSLKQSVESALGTENVVIDIQQMSDSEQENITYFADAGSQKDYDLHISGWGPDYQDPSTYLDIWNPESGGSLKNLGLEAGQNTDITNAVGLNEYQTLLEEANAETSDVTSRYEKYAAAQAWLTDSAIILPVSSTGATPMISKVSPFTKAYSVVGVKGDANIFKFMELQSEPVKTSDYNKARETWLKEQKESQEKAQEEIANHVK